jgi:hypothetical protein
MEKEERLANVIVRYLNNSGINIVWGKMLPASKLNEISRDFQTRNPKITLSNSKNRFPEANSENK